MDVSKGGVSYNVTQVTTNYTCLSTDYFLAIDSTNSAIVITLTSTTSNINQFYSFSKISDDYNTVTIQGVGTDLIGGTATLILQMPFSTVNLICSASGTWEIMNFNSWNPSPDIYGLFPSTAGIDGTVTISANTTLVRNMYYSNLTVNSGITLNASGWRILVTGTLTLNGNISNDGTSAVANVAGTSPTVATTYLGCGTSGGNGATGSNPGTAGSNSTYACVGGIGGQGGSVGGVAGTLTAPAAIDGGLYILSQLPNAWMGRSSVALNSTVSYLQGGTGGGSGKCNKGSATTVKSGAGGAGAGIVTVAAKIVTGTGSITANGGNGGNSSFTGSSVGITGGGGGGGGGVVVFIYQIPVTTITLSANGGTGGTAIGGGTAGVSGANGYVYSINV